jgi:hypothetical protein
MPLSSEIPSYKDFVKNPIVGLLFMCLLAIGYLYIDNRNTLTKQIEDLKEEVKELKAENAILYNKIIEISKKVK